MVVVFIPPSTMPSLLYLALLDPRLNKLRYGAAIVMFLSIVITGSIPGARAGIGHYAPGVVLHSLAYATLALLWFVMGAFDELLQSMFPYRGAAVSDWMVDVSAALVTCAILSLLLPKAAARNS
jgi:hypothetical protein